MSDTVRFLLKKTKHFAYGKAIRPYLKRMLNPNEDEHALHMKLQRALFTWLRNNLQLPNGWVLSRLGPIDGELLEVEKINFTVQGRDVKLHSNKIDFKYIDSDDVVHPEECAAVRSALATINITA